MKHCFFEFASARDSEDIASIILSQFVAHSTAENSGNEPYKVGIKVINIRVHTVRTKAKVLLAGGYDIHRHSAQRCSGIGG
jgi:hypothetical protein